jgi:TonB family protein
VDSEPTGASVSVNGELRGVTPLTLESLALGEYEIKVDSKGYQPAIQKVTLADAQKQAVHAVLTRAAPVTGSVDILSTPFGAVIVVDGAGVGQTPLAGYKVKPGSHRIEIVRPGYEPWSTNIKVVAGQSQRVDVNLKALPASVPSPKAETVDVNKVYDAGDVDEKPRKLSGASPSYPDGAKRLKSGQSVSSRVSFVVTETGEVRDVNVMESGGKLVDDVVVGTVKTWKYAPGQKRGVKVKVQMTIKQTFQAG